MTTKITTRPKATLRVAIRKRLAAIHKTLATPAERRWYTIAKRQVEQQLKTLPNVRVDSTGFTRIGDDKIMVMRTAQGTYQMRHRDPADNPFMHPTIIRGELAGGDICGGHVNYWQAFGQRGFGGVNRSRR